MLIVGNGKRFLSRSCQLLSKPFKVAIVGTGPGGFYTAHHLLNKSGPEKDIHIDFFEKLPTPFGLSRYGVAPDHPEVKNCEEFLTDLMKDYRASAQNKRHRVRFIGNVEIGKDIKLGDLESHYNSIVLAYGSTASDNKLDIPGANSPQVIPARQFVNWYNGHPDCYNTKNKYQPPPLDKVKDVTIIGNGNVALDVARILLANPTTHWKHTDISTEAEKLLEKSTVKNVRIVARRGILESAFSNKEIRELLELKGVQFIPVDTELLQEVAAKKLGRVDKRRVSLLEKYSRGQSSADKDDKLDASKIGKRTWSLEYFLSPVEFVNDENGNLVETIFRKNKPIDDPLLPGRIETTETRIKVENQLVILSIGYKGTPIDGFEELGIWFEKNKLHNKGGRILKKISEKENEVNATYKKGWYTSGWIKNGPKGVIATTMMDSFDTAENILEDMTNGVYIDVAKDSDITDKLAKEIVLWDNWEKLDQYELEEGKKLEKSRYKVCNKEDMLKVCK